jgi:hypothetical protein
VISWTIVQRVTNLELTTDEVKQQCKNTISGSMTFLRDANHIIPQGKNILALQDWNSFPVEENPDFVEEF